MRTYTTINRTLALALTAVAAGACSDVTTPVAPVVPSAPSLGKGPNLPPVNGRIYFTSNFTGGSYDVYSMKPDGSDRRRLTITSDNERYVTVSPDGKKLVVATLRPDTTASELVMMNADGTNRRVLFSVATASLAYPAFSPDGRTLAYTSRDLNTDARTLWTIPVAGGKATRLTESTESAVTPSWSPDGKRIVYKTSPPGWAGLDTLVFINADGSGRQLLAPCPKGDCLSPEWLPDGSRIIYAGRNASGLMTEIQYCDLLQAVPQCGNSIPTEGHVWATAVSPDGSQVVYTSFTIEGGAEVERVRSANVNGTGQTVLTADLKYVLDVAWGR